MAKFRKGQCVDLSDITETGEKYWNNGWKIDKVFPNYYRVKHPVTKGTTWAIDRSLKSSKKCGKISYSKRRK